MSFDFNQLKRKVTRMDPKINEIPHLVEWTSIRVNWTSVECDFIECTDEGLAIDIY